MTNKTITLSCCTCGKPTACGKMICEACCYEPLPVPPAGGKPDPIIAVLKGHLADGMNPMFSGGDLKHLIGLLEASTRLQAEVERLKQAGDVMAGAVTALDKRNAEVLALQSELTKARELIADMVKQQVEAGTDYTADVGRAKAYLSSQSAPADSASEKLGPGWYGCTVGSPISTGISVVEPAALGQSAPADKDAK